MELTIISGEKMPKCLRCNRELKSEESIQRGMGLKCMGHSVQEKMNKIKTMDEYFNEDNK